MNRSTPQGRESYLSSFFIWLLGAPFDVVQYNESLGQEICSIKYPANLWTFTFGDPSIRFCVPTAPIFLHRWAQRALLGIKWTRNEPFVDVY